jgi:hypothetical protein
MTSGRLEYGPTITPTDVADIYCHGILQDVKAIERDNETLSTEQRRDLKEAYKRIRLMLVRGVQ